MGEETHVLSMGERKILVLAIASLFVIAGGFIFWKLESAKTLENGKQKPTLQSESMDLKVKSSAFAHYSDIPTRFTCDGANINPPLSISGVPPRAKSLALIVDDPDAPLGTYVHWVIWNISSQTTEIAEGTVPVNAQEGTNSVGKSRYDGPCPPARHRYFFKLYALDTLIGLNGQARATELAKAMQGHILAESHLIGVYTSR